MMNNKIHASLTHIGRLIAESVGLWFAIVRSGCKAMFVFIIIFILAIIIYTGIMSWINDHRGPLEITYCLQHVDFGKPQHKCVETKTLKIPRAYGDSINSSYTDPQLVILEIAYPSMQPWKSVPWSERSNTQKIQLDIHGVHRAPVLDDKRLIFIAPPKEVQRLEPLLGLKAYEKDGRLILVPFDPVWNIAIECANGKYPQKPAIGGCWIYSNNDWNLFFLYHHEQTLLPEWRTVNDKLFALVNSFVVSP
jgi:hypothetical protein